MRIAQSTVDFLGSDVMLEWYVLLPLMVLCHIIADFHLQGIMGDMKQKSFWKPYGEQYQNDWKPVMLLHGIEWAIIVSVPCLLTSWFDVSWWFIAAVIVTGLTHAYIDNLKANNFQINLIEDQALHMLQIVLLLVAYGVMI